ncbi:MAG: AAA family ATPase [candidate division WS1 bacterium]|jgi:CRISPR-associated exonuclease Cas4|nr:AAA family ATPase [candidate division WS1 bacterium]
MLIQSLKIHNFRSIKDLELGCKPHTVLLGPNNHGKSNVLRALEFLLTPAAKADPSDLCEFAGDGTLWVEAEFCGPTDQEKTTFRKYLLPDGVVRIRKTTKWTPDGSETRYQGYTRRPTERWLWPESAGEFTSQDSLAGTGLCGMIEGRLSKQKVEEAQEKYIAEHQSELEMEVCLEERPLMGRSNVAGGVLPSLYLVPAVCDLAEETRTRSTALLGRLLSRALGRMAERDGEFAGGLKKTLADATARLNERNDQGQLLLPEIRDIEQAVGDELRSWDVTVQLKVEVPAIERLFELGTQLHLDDGVPTTGERKGHGLQRAVIFALIKAWALAVRGEAAAQAAPAAGDELQPGGSEGKTVPRTSSHSFYLAIEEPEIYLHPHAQWDLASALRNLACEEGIQVFLTTHSTHFVDVQYYDEIQLLSKPDPQTGTTVRQCDTDLFGNDEKAMFNMGYWVNPDRGELFFARKVVFVEGATERTVLPYLAGRLGWADSSVSVIDCGSKHNLPLYAQLANAFSLQYVVVHDEDPLPSPVPDEWSEDKRREKQRTYCLNDDIGKLCESGTGKAIMVPGCFEKTAGIPSSQGEKLGKPLAALNYLTDLEDEKLPQDLVDLVRSIYA